MQGNHCTSTPSSSSTGWASGDRARSAYAWRSLLDAGATVINGTDAPVEDVDPPGSFHASVTRRLAGGHVLLDSRRPQEEALVVVHDRCSLGRIRRDPKGSLPGKLADVPSCYPKTCGTARRSGFSQGGVAYTIIGGKIVYAAD